MVTHPPAAGLAAALAMFVPVCAPQVRPTAPAPEVPITSLWQRPDNLVDRDLFYGSWGAASAPMPADTYSLVGIKRHGVNPGLTVRDSHGRKWSVKQPHPDLLGDEGPVEVTLSRVLDAVGYRQPPVSYLPAFWLRDDWGVHREPGGRFRLSVDSLDELDAWSWQQNPFVGTRPYQGLLVILLLLNSSDLKNSNNSVYLHRAGDRAQLWYVVRDLGSALGETGRFAPVKNDPALYERSRFILGVRDGFVQFAHKGWHQELVRRRLTPGDVRWGAELLSGLSDEQWHAAFRAGGYAAPQADRFIRKIHSNIAQGLALDAAPSPERR